MHSLCFCPLNSAHSFGLDSRSSLKLPSFDIHGFAAWRKIYCPASRPFPGEKMFVPTTTFFTETLPARALGRLPLRVDGFFWRTLPKQRNGRRIPSSFHVVS